MLIGSPGLLRVQTPPYSGPVEDLDNSNQEKKATSINLSKYRASAQALASSVKLRQVYKL